MKINKTLKAFIYALLTVILACVLAAGIICLKLFFGPTGILILYGTFVLVALTCMFRVVSND